MSTTDPELEPASDTHALPSERPRWVVLGRRLAIWTAFLVLIYIARDFFFTAFVTFLVCYYTLLLVGWAIKRLSPNCERLWLRRLVTIGIFCLVPMLLVGVGILVSPHLAAQGKRMSGWLRYASPETEAARILEDTVGYLLFQSEYGKPGSQTYRDGLQEFLNKGERHAREYFSFPFLEEWVLGSIVNPIADEERQRVRSRMLSEGTSSASFTDWFINEKAPRIIAEAEQEITNAGRNSTSLAPRTRVAASSTPEQLLEKIQREPSRLANYRNEWIDETLDNYFYEEQQSIAFKGRIRTAFDQQRRKTPEMMPYSFDEFIQLAKDRQNSRVAFTQTIDRIRPPPPDETPEEKESRLLADFEASRQHDLFQEWWSSSDIAKFLRQQLQSMVQPNVASGYFEAVLSSLFNVPVAIATALTLSIFICIDFLNLKQSASRLRYTWLGGVYDEIVPALVDMGHLIGRFMQLQGLIALISAILIGIGLAFLGVEQVMLLSLATFLLCMVPTIGSIFAILLIVVFALFQYGGGLSLAIEAGIMASIVSLIDSFFLSPRIIGKSMELHPVTIITVLPLAQYFFGIWGLILATPVTVYVVNVLILQRGLPDAKQNAFPACVDQPLANDGMPVDAPAQA